MIALTEYWLSRRVQQTAASKVHLPVDPKIVKDGLGSTPAVGGSDRAGSKPLEADLRAALRGRARGASPAPVLHTPRSRDRELRTASDDAS